MLKVSAPAFFSKNTSCFIKCIAIVLMLYHHLIGFDYWHLQFVVSSVPQLVSFGKVCIDLFAFVTGVAFFTLRERYQKGSYRLEKGISFLLQYQLVCLIFLTVGLWCGEPMPDFLTLVKNLFGLETGVGGTIADYSTIPPVFTPFGKQYVNVCHAWYVFFYLLALAAYPLFQRLSTGKGMLADAGLLVLLFSLLCAFALLTGVSAIPYVEDFLNYIPIIALGYLIAKNRTYEAFEKLPSAFTLLLGVFVLAATVVIRSSAIDEANFPLRAAWIYVPLLVYFFAKVGKTGALFLKKIPKLYKICQNTVLFIAANSMNVWYLHGIFNTPHQSLQFIAYLPRSAILIVGWVLVLLSVVSVAVSIPQRMLSDWCRQTFQTIKKKRNGYDKTRTG